jgi:hypothetical protein
VKSGEKWSLIQSETVSDLELEWKRRTGHDPETKSKRAQQKAEQELQQETAQGITDDALRGGSKHPSQTDHRRAATHYLPAPAPDHPRTAA